MKPTVTFINDVVYYTRMFEDCEVAHVQTVNHPTLGATWVRTSKVLNKFEDGSFETVNHIYTPYKDSV